MLAFLVKEGAISKEQSSEQFAFPHAGFLTSDKFGSTNANENTSPRQQVEEEAEFSYFSPWNPTKTGPNTLNIKIIKLMLFYCEKSLSPITKRDCRISFVGAKSLKNIICKFGNLFALFRSNPFLLGCYPLLFHSKNSGQ